MTTPPRCPSCDHLTADHAWDGSGCLHQIRTRPVGADAFCPCGHAGAAQAAEKTRRRHILDKASDLAADFMYYDRKEDEDLPRGAIEEAIAAGEITVDEIVAEFRRHVEGADQ